jgi:hypothetical protein
MIPRQIAMRLYPNNAKATFRLTSLAVPHALIRLESRPILILTKARLTGRLPSLEGHCLRLSSLLITPLLIP